MGPTEGQEYTFICKAAGHFSSHFKAYDTDQAPWIDFTHSGNFDDKGGKLIASMVHIPEGQSSGKELLTAVISAPRFGDVSTRDKDDHWFWGEGDKKTKMKW